MPSSYPIQTNYTGGELSPRMGLRSDFVKYNNGMETCENLIPLVQGPMTNRDGTRFVHEVLQYTTANPAKIVPFEKSVTAAYVLEFGNAYIRFYKNGGIIVEGAKTITNAVNNGSGLIRITATGHGYATNDHVLIEGVVGTIEANGEWKITIIDANTFDLVGSAFVNAYVSGGTSKRIFAVVTTYTGTDPTSLRWAQSQDVLYLVSSKGTHPLKRVNRFGDTNWTHTTPTLIGGPFGPLNNTTTTLTPSATSGSITITASSTTGINNGNGFIASDVGRLVRIKHSSTWGWARITSITSTTVVNATVESNFGAITASDDWHLGLFTDTIGPRALAIYEQRLVLAIDDTVALSRTGDFEDFTPSNTDGTVNNDHGMTFRLGSQESNEIKWLLPGRQLLIGTAKNEWNLFGSQDAAISPTNVTARRQTRHGSSETVIPVFVENVGLFVQKSDRKSVV